MRARQSEIDRRGSRIFELVDKHPESLFSKAGFYQRLMALSMRDERFKVQLFRFVDVLPSLRHSREFIAGKNPNDVIKTLRKRRSQKIGFTVDLLGEAVVSEADADEYAARYLDLLEKLAQETKNWIDPLGKNSELFPVVNLSVKLSALYSQINPADPANAIAHLAPKFRPFLRRARELGAFL